MAGVAPHPTREVYIELTRRITIDGGKALTTRHAGARVEYPQSVSDEARRMAEDGAQSCGCGDTRMVMISYMIERETPDGEMIETERRYVACVNCDAVALQPRWYTGKWAPKDEGV